MLERLEARTLLTTGFVETPLVSNVPGLAPNTDRELINPWGFAETSSGQFRVAANGSGQGILFDAQGQKSGADITIPPPADSPAGTNSTPNGVIINTTSDFVITFNGRSAPATMLFSTEDGTIAGWNPALSQTRAVIAADQSGNGAVYKLLTMDQAGGANYLYATNFHNGTVDVFDAHFARHTFFAGQFTDPNAPAGFAPFGIKNVNGTLFVSYAKQDDAKHDDVAGPGNGFIDEFTSDGHFIKRFASGTAAGGTLTALNSPIGATFAPAGFGNFGGDLLIGNFGDSHVSAFDPSTGQFLGQLQDTHGQPLVLTAGITGADGNTKGLWGIGFGNGQGGAGTQSMFFADGPNDETDGIFGEVNVAPASATLPPSTGVGALAGEPGDGTAQTFVQNLSRELLGREPDQAGDSFWVSSVQQHNDSAGHQTVIQGFMNSQEFKTHFVSSVYQIFLGRAADPNGLSFWTAKMGSPGTPGQNAGSADEKFIVAAFLSSDEFFIKAGNTPQGWVNALYEDVFGRAPDGGGMAFWTNEMRLRGAGDRAGIVRDLLTTPEAAHDLLDSFYPAAGGTASHPLAAPGTPAGVGLTDLARLTGGGWENLYLEGPFDGAPEANDKFFAFLAGGGNWDDAQFLMLGADQFYTNPNRPVTS